MKIDKEILSSLFDMEDIVRKADAALNIPDPHITDSVSRLSEGTRNDYFSTADYWWPNTDTPDGLPFIKRDGESWPDGFFDHRLALRRMRTSTASLAAAFYITKDEKYAKKATEMLYEFFINDDTRMNPNLIYAQAILGVCSGRGIGVIDTLHLIDVPYAIEALKTSRHMTDDIYRSLKGWFAEYLEWLCTHPQAVDEMNQDNNHGICWNVQAGCFAVFTENEKYIELCRQRYEDIYLPEQMAADGSFPRELSRTKPYNYSNFTLDNMVNNCLVLSNSHDDCDLWDYKTPDGRGIQKGLDFLFPFVEDITKWPYEKDIEHFEEFPASMTYLLFAGLRYKNDKYIEAYKKYSQKSYSDEIRRNMAIREPLLFLIN